MANEVSLSTECRMAQLHRVKQHSCCCTWEEPIAATCFPMCPVTLLTPSHDPPKQQKYKKATGSGTHLACSLLQRACTVLRLSLADHPPWTLNPILLTGCCLHTCHRSDGLQTLLRSSAAREHIRICSFRLR
jgi:hypothetical protein